MNPMPQSENYRFSSKLRELIPLLWNRLGSGRWLLVVALVFCLAETLLMMYLPWLMEVYFNRLEEGRAMDAQWLLLRSSLLMLLLIGMGLWGHYLKQDKISSLHREVTLELADHAQRLPLENAQAAHTADLTQRIRHDSNQTTWIFNTIFQGMGAQFVMLVLACIYMLTLHWPIAIGVMLLMPLGLLGSHLLRHRLQNIGRKVADQEAVVRQCQQDALQNREAIKAFGVEGWMEERFTAQRAQLNRLYMRRMWWQRLVDGLTNTLALSISWGAVLLVAWLAVEGMLQLSSLMAFFILIWRVFNPMLNLGRMWGEIQEKKGSADRVAALWQAAKEPANRAMAPESPVANSPALCWNDITFRYGEGDGLLNADPATDQPAAQSGQGVTMLEQLQLTIAPGTFTAIVGPSGSGKSTVAKLGAGLLFPASGTMELFGISPLQDAEYARRLIAYVPQNPYLFAGSIRDNLLMVRHDAAEEELIEAAKAAQAHDFIMAMPGGYDTRISEHGGSLSGGQRQRLAIARAILADRPIWVLDEATSALDLDTERRVMDAVLARSRNSGRTLLVIAHRLTTIQSADHIIAMDAGCIAEQGTHHQLLSEDGLYRKLWSQMHGDHENAC
ncbi:ABC transporter ATP-binding protein [Paenibacillaceae bacterium]|nr:ABC transporter ATP-binding protein [Paenibacillaceae bacterium]